jgi:hypothetical protein
MKVMLRPGSDERSMVWEGSEQVGSEMLGREKFVRWLQAPSSSGLGRSVGKLVSVGVN